MGSLIQPVTMSGMGQPRFGKKQALPALAIMAASLVASGAPTSAKADKPVWPDGYELPASASPTVPTDESEDTFWRDARYGLIAQQREFQRDLEKADENLPREMGKGLGAAAALFFIIALGLTGAELLRGRPKKP